MREERETEEKKQKAKDVRKFLSENAVPGTKFTYSWEENGYPVTFHENHVPTKQPSQLGKTQINLMNQSAMEFIRAQAGEQEAIRIEQFVNYAPIKKVACLECLGRRSEV